MQAIIYVLEFPPKLSWRILVNFEFRYVINWGYFFYAANAEITFPNSRRPIFMFMPYFKVTPVAPVFFALSDPARSTKKNFAVIKPSSSEFYELLMGCCYIKIVNIAWDLDDDSFIRVAAVVRCILPLSRRFNIWLESTTFFSVAP